MAYGVKLKVWGDYASFNRPEMKVERVSYDVMTPSAARGILEAIYWKPEMRWVVDEIRVLKPIRFTHVRRNEINNKIPTRTVAAAMEEGAGNLGINVAAHRQQRAAMLLKDVCYGIHARVEVLTSPKGETHPEAKHLEMFKRRARKGQYFHHPYLGCREFPADFELVDSFPDCPGDLAGARDLGFMLHDLVFSQNPKGKVVESSRGLKLDTQPRFFRPIMTDGVIKVPPLSQTRG